MAQDTGQGSDPLQDRAQVRIFTLADFVAEEASGKLYISGGGLEWSGLPTRANELPPFYMAIRLAFPISIARESHVVEVRALDAEGNAMGPDPLVRAEIHFDLSRAPAYASEMSGTLPVLIAQYPLTSKHDGVIFLHLITDGILVSRLPVALLDVEA